MTIFERFDVVGVPFPFIDLETKTRPALVLSSRNFNAAHHASMLAMITTPARSRSQSDIPVNHAAAGLQVASVVRLKLFTLENSLIMRRVGALAATDRARVTTVVASWLEISA